MKKFLCLLLALTMLFSLCACGAGVKENDASKPAEADAAVDEADAAADEAQDAKFVFLDEDLGTETYAIGFRKGDEELAQTVSGAFKALVLDGTYAQIGSKYEDIKDFLCLKAEDIDTSDIPEKGSGDSTFTFKHGFDLDYPPYSYRKDDGSVGGFDVEMCKAVCDYLGWQYEAVPFNWEAKDMELNAKSCDCIWSGFTKEGREDMYTWGITYSNNTQGILVAADSDIKTLADLAGKTVGVQIDTSAAEMLEDSQKELADTFGALNTYETYTVAFNDLKAGAIDAIAIDMTAGTYLISSAS